MNGFQQERDTHFQGYAEQVYNDLEGNFRLLCTKMLMHDDREVERLQAWLQTYLARHAYDLMYYGLEEMNPISLQSYETTHEIIAKEIPDFTEWPVEPKQS